ncbi:beta-lactamase domain protein [Melioribacter roseus P3M-2]|uniref:Beta-lactamase domain protein n=1 Tax=Melioribacter roseus (strain DSM 23840 / JCM 17771 / VKM B-2668 / P3M-2) TaxID=1191523 RepID=I7A0W1_MELRP|nr:MBL fold metallo-hydrolase [Melioribacter roseus]AFN74873.1 beta-lactamase domain protein [Melioribacter roseus P3M-2]
MIKFLSIGGAREVGANSYYLQIDGTGILLDCGIHPRKKGLDSLPLFDLLENYPLDFVIISHAHQDHVGALPFLIKKFPHVIIYTTPYTKELVSVTLHNAVNILKKETNGEENISFFTHEEIDLLVRSIRDYDYNEEFELRGLNSSAQLKGCFFDAGHILGSAMVMIKTDDKKILYTGDMNLSDQSIEIGADLEALNDVDFLIMESTYGDTNTKLTGNWESERNRFINELNKIISKGGSVLIPVFALGKMQEMLMLIYEAIRSGKLTDAEVYTGGIGREISSIYDRYRYVVRRKNRDTELKQIPQSNLYEINDYNHYKKNPGYLLASSGMMLEGTMSFQLAEFWLKQKDFAVFGVGYMDPATPGYKIINAKNNDALKLRGDREINVECEINRFYFSAHANRDGLINFAKSLKPETVILVHGEESAQNWLGFHLLESDPGIKLFSAELGKEIILRD